jgi:hypothetical protein
VAALLKEKIGVDPDLVVGKRGEFTVWIGDTCVAQKDAQGFPADEDVLAAVKRAIAHG